MKPWKWILIAKSATNSTKKTRIKSRGKEHSDINKILVKVLNYQTISPKDILQIFLKQWKKLWKITFYLKSIFKSNIKNFSLLAAIRT